MVSLFGLCLLPAITLWYWFRICAQVLAYVCAGGPGVPAGALGAERRVLPRRVLARPVARSQPAAPAHRRYQPSQALMTAREINFDASMN